MRSDCPDGTAKIDRAAVLPNSALPDPRHRARTRIPGLRGQSNAGIRRTETVVSAPLDDLEEEPVFEGMGVDLENSPSSSRSYRISFCFIDPMSSDRVRSGCRCLRRNCPGSSGTRRPPTASRTQLQRCRRRRSQRVERRPQQIPRGTATTGSGLASTASQPVTRPRPSKVFSQFISRCHVGLYALHPVSSRRSLRGVATLSRSSRS